MENLGCGKCRHFLNEKIGFGVYPKCRNKKNADKTCWSGDIIPKPKILNTNRECVNFELKVQKKKWWKR